MYPGLDILSSPKTWVVTFPALQWDSVLILWLMSWLLSLLWWLRQIRRYILQGLEHIKKNGDEYDDKDESEQQTPSWSRERGLSKELKRNWKRPEAEASCMFITTVVNNSKDKRIIEEPEEDMFENITLISCFTSFMASTGSFFRREVCFHDFVRLEVSLGLLAVLSLVRSVRRLWIPLSALFGFCSDWLFLQLLEDSYYEPSAGIWRSLLPPTSLNFLQLQDMLPEPYSIYSEPCKKRCGRRMERMKMKSGGDAVPKGVKGETDQ